MVALAQMVSTVILVSVLVATLSQLAKQVCITHDIKSHGNPQFMSTQEYHFLTIAKGVILIC